ncbi:MAG: ABC transporter permease [Saprospiraceae bacterium]|nr:ABC transporter permease [Saprospiraceae bacterium]
MTKSIMTLVVLSFLGLWVIDQIPGTAEDLGIEENPELMVKKENQFPLFYFSVLKEREVGKSLDWIDFVPQFSWNAGNNQYHQILTKPSYSQKDGIPVSKKMMQALSWTFALQVPAVILIFLLSWFLAVWVIQRHSEKWTKSVIGILTLLHAVPVFWFGSLLILFFANPDFLNWFPSMYLGDASMGGFSAWMQQPSCFILPLITLVLPSLAILFLLSHGGLNAALQQRFWMRAYSFGIPFKEGLKHEIYPHALIPILGWIAAAIPFLMAGSLVVESIFSIPGVGRLMYQSVAGRDWTVAYWIFMVSAIFTLAGMLIADLIQWYLDPRTRKG